MNYKRFCVKPLITLIGIVLSLTPFYGTYAEDNDWQIKATLQSYIQTYDGSLTRQGTFNAGAYLGVDYLDSGGIILGYNYTFVDFDNNAELTEHMFYLSGHYNLYLDALPGKLTLRLDGYFGEDSLKYNINNPPGSTGGGGMGGGGMGGGGGTTTPASVSHITETTDITAYHPQIAFINYAKTFYVDIGYAYSEYTGISDTKVDQLTPTIGFGWNESYDWLQLRGYFIKINESIPVHADDQFESLEIKYTHWFPDSSPISLDYVRLSALIGERLWAVDPDAGVIYSTADKQTGTLTGSIQWKLSQATNLLALVSYGQHENESINDEYDSWLFYLNLQFNW